MQHFITQLFKRKRRREYLYDEFSPKKSNFIIWIQRFIVLIALVILAMFILSINTLAQASTFSSDYSHVRIKDVSQGSLLVKTQSPGDFLQLPLLHSNVNMNISGMIARTHVKQHFKNTSDDWIEAIYVFPLPETAAVDHMRMLIGQRVIEGQIKEKTEAKQIYRQAKREGKKVALVEQQRANLFTNSVANIGPGESIIVEIEYQQVLHYEQGDFSVRFPMAITPRYIPGKAINESVSVSGNGWALNTDQVNDASTITPPVFSQPSSAQAFSTASIFSKQKKHNTVSLNIELDAGFPLKKINSRYHSIQQSTTALGTTVITLANELIPSDRDFELVWTPNPGYAPKAALFSETLVTDQYQLVMILPPDSENYNDQPLAREVTFIIDTSGSMHGVSMQQAKKSLIMALDRLRVHDRFNIIQFNSATEKLFYNTRLADFQNILLAKQFVQRLKANGGTEMAPALKLALDEGGQNHDEENSFVHQVIFLTDGSVGNEAALFKIINNNLGNKRLFTIGIGSAPNSYFMRKAAQFGRGTFTYISDVNEVTEKMTGLFKKLENPLMTDLEINFPDNINAEIWPQRFPDLYYGEPLVLAIKTQAALDHITLQGRQALSPWSASIDLKQSQTSKGIATFWARNKIAALMDSRHTGVNKTEVRNEVVDIALKHHLVSQFTSLVAVDTTPARTQESRLQKKIMPVNPPHGQTISKNMQQVFGRLPQAATSAEMQFFFGCSLLFLGLLSQLIHQPAIRKKLKHLRLL